MPNEQEPQDYQSLLEMLKLKAQNAKASAQQAWGGAPKPQSQQHAPEQGDPAYMQAGSQPNYKQDANTVMETGGFAHPQEAPPPPPPPPQPTPTAQRTPPPAYMLPVRNQNNADMFMRSAKFKK